MGIFESGHTHPLIVFEDDLEVHHKKGNCRPVHESDYDAKDFMRGELEGEGFEICDCVEDHL